MRHTIGWEPEGHYCISKMFHWEPEGRYCCTKSMVIGPFWFSMENLWNAIMPFLFSTDDALIHAYTSCPKSWKKDFCRPGLHPYSLHIESSATWSKKLISDGEWVLVHSHSWRCEIYTPLQTTCIYEHREAWF